MKPKDGEPNTQASRRQARTAVLLGSAALVLRLVVIFWRRAHDPLFLQPINDAAVYDMWARSIALGSGDGLPFQPDGAPYFLPPLYPYFTALFYKFNGGDIWFVMILQALMGVITVLGIHRLGVRLHGNRAGMLAGVVALLSAPTLWYEGWQLPTTLNLFLLVIVLNFLVECLDPYRDRWSRPGLMRVGLGLSLGLASLNRPQNLLQAVLILAVLCWGDRRSRWRGFRSPVLILAVMALTIAPVTFRNLITSGEPVPISANGGVNFYIGNHLGADGRFSFPPGFPAFIGLMPAESRRLASEEAGRELDWRQTSAHWFRQGLDDLAANPGRSVMLGLHKVRLVVSWREMENNFVVRWVRERSGPARWLIPSLGLLWLMALPAMIEAVRRREPRDLVLLVPAATVVVVCLLFWVSTRNRLPLLIPLAIWSGVSLSSLKYWKSPVSIAAITLVAVAVFWPTTDREGAGFLCDVGRIHAQRGEIAEARANFTEALRLEPDHPMAMNGMALTYMDAGQPKRAIALLREVIRKHPDFELAKQNLQAILNHQKNQP
jgi:4-amino-4-deoxy-L-arabinose transferase-like glycosyltransferase